MDKNLFIKALSKFIVGAVFIALLLFIPAGTICYWNAWLLMGLLFIPMSIVGVLLMLKNPDLLRKRLNAKEKESEQKGIIAISGIMFIGGFIVAGLDYRFQWFVLPQWLVWLAAVLFVIAYLLYAEVLRENTYLSRTIEIQKNQKVIDTGLYGIVRHPMYMATILLFLMVPLILGSVFSFFIFLIYPIVILKRIENEEKVLEAGLEGYSDYKKRVKYRIVPYIW